MYYPSLATTICSARRNIQNVIVRGCTAVVFSLEFSILESSIGCGRSVYYHVKRLDLFQYIGKHDKTEAVISHSGKALAHLSNFQVNTKILVTLYFNPVLCNTAVDKSAAFPLQNVQHRISLIRALLCRECKITMKFGYILKFDVDTKKLTFEHWKQKTNVHQMVRSVPRTDNVRL
jgi:hypothetical protein